MLTASSLLSWYSSLCGSMNAADALYAAGHAFGALAVGACAHVAWDIFLAATGALPGEVQQLHLEGAPLDGCSRHSGSAAVHLSTQLNMLIALRRPSAVRSAGTHLICMGLGRRGRWPVPRLVAGRPANAPRAPQDCGRAAGGVRRAAGPAQVSGSTSSRAQSSAWRVCASASHNCSSRLNTCRAGVGVRTSPYLGRAQYRPLPVPNAGGAATRPACLSSTLTCSCRFSCCCSRRLATWRSITRCSAPGRPTIRSRHCCARCGAACGRQWAAGLTLPTDAGQLAATRLARLQAARPPALLL